MRMKFFYMVLILFFTEVLSAAEDISTLRKMVEASASSAVSAKAFYAATKNMNAGSKPILLGFKAMSELMMCNHVLSPISKLSYFSRGKILLESAIAKQPDNVELRYFRFSAQCNTPAILNYSSNLVEDKEVLLRYLKMEFKNPDKDSDLYARIKKFMANCKYCSDKEKANLNR